MMDLTLSLISNDNLLAGTHLGGGGAGKNLLKLQADLWLQLILGNTHLRA